MTGPLEFVEAAHKQAEQVARAAGGDEWHGQGHPADTVAVYDSKGDPVVYDEGAPTAEQIAHIALHDPLAVLLRIMAERVLVTKHRPTAGDAWDGTRTVCHECAHHTLEKSEGSPYPCATVRLLATAWGWTKEEQE